MTSSLRRFFRLLPLALALPVAAAAQVNLTVNAAQAIRTVDERVFGVNAVIWDAQAGSAQTSALVQNAGIRTIRVPGGSLSDEYHWRVNKSLANTWSWSTGFNGFINLITSTNTQPVVTVNYGSGTPEEAAGLVAYLNASVGSSTVIAGTDGTGFAMQDSGYWAALRAAGPLGSDDGMNFLRISRSSPVGAKYFEIGNECYGTWETDQQTVAHDPTTYANRVQQYITKMKAVDPSIKIGVVLVTSSENASYKNWTPTMLARLKVLNAIPDFVIYHLYPQAPGAESDATLLQVADAGSKSWPTIAADLRQQLTANLGATLGAGVEIVVTENNSVYSSPGKQSTSLVNGLYLADSIGNLMQTEINGYMYWALRNGPPTINNGTALDGNMSASLYGWRQFGDYGMLSSPSTLTGETTYYDPYPTYYMMKLLSHFARGGDTVVQATSNNPLLSIFAAKRADGSLGLLVINKDASNPQNASVALSGYTPRALATVYSYGKLEDAAGSAQDITTTSIAISGSTFSASFSSYSATVISVGAASTTSPPIITTQPTNTASRAGALLQLMVVASGTPAPSYQWKKNGMNIIGATTSTYSVASGSTNDSGVYAVVVANSAGSVTSNDAVVVVSASPGSDFNTDGFSDILWQNTFTGERFMWLMTGTAHGAGVSLGFVATSWSSAATADFNGDGQPDILWQNMVTGERYIWFMSGAGHVSDASLGVVGLQWLIAAAADFNGDGQTDLLWQNMVTGERYIWFMSGAGHVSDASLGVVGLQWSIAAAADFNGDGQTDLLWQNIATGERYIWFMNGAGHMADASLGMVDTQWSIAAAADFNGDGQTDLLWQNIVTGQRYLWLMKGTAHQSDVDLGFVDLSWRIVK